MAYTRCLSLPVALGLILVTSVYYTVVVLTIKPWMGIFTANGLLNTLTYTLWYLMVLWSYSLSILKDPGSIPPRYQPEVEDGSASLQEVKRKDGELRFCKKCINYKPPRAHHCRICKRCVLRMDHHCIWINNCVGHRNYKAFVLFVLYDVLALSHGLVLILSHAAACLFTESGLSASQCLRRIPTVASPFTWMDPSPPAATFFRVACVVICLPLGISLLVLLLWHVYLIALNKTTIEMASSRGHACRKCKSDEDEEDRPTHARKAGHKLLRSPGQRKGQEEKGQEQEREHEHEHPSAKPRDDMAACSAASVLPALLSRRSIIAMFFAHYEGVRAKCLNAKAAEYHLSHPYDLGLTDNLNAILGPNPFFWFIPSATEYLQSGLRFPTGYDSAMSIGSRRK